MQSLSRDVRYCEICLVCIFLCYTLFCPGCGPALSSPEQIIKFKQAGPIKSELADENGATGLKSHTGPYRVITGDILEFQMPAVLRVISSDLPKWLQPISGRGDFEPYLVRVSQAGTITLPIIGQIPVAGNTLAQIEASIVDAYYPKYVMNHPMVVCEVKKYQSESERVFAVMGLVNKSGVFPYPSDVQYNLMEALGFAGGLDMAADPRFVRIYRQDASGEVVSATFGVDKKLMADAYSLGIKPGDVIYIDHTLHTRINTFLSNAFYIRAGASANVNPVD